MLRGSEGFLAFGFHFAILERDVPTIKANHAHNSFGTATLPLVDCSRGLLLTIESACGGMEDTALLPVSLLECFQARIVL